MVCLKLFSNLIWLITINNIASETVSCYIYLQISIVYMFLYPDGFLKAILAIQKNSIIPNHMYSAPATAKSRQSCPALCDPGSPPGSPVPGILQARTPEWVAMSFSNAWK